MTPQQIEFLQRAIIQQQKFDQIAAEMGMPRPQVSQWWEELKVQREELAAIRKIGVSKGFDNSNIQAFINWYKEAEKKCYYCDLTEEQMAALWEKDPELTKRFRGEKLEIDRKKPNVEYAIDPENLVLCCYWCNNAKTDTFTEEEFKEVGQVFKSIWQKRLNQ